VPERFDGCRLVPIGRLQPTADNQGVSSSIAARFGLKVRRLRQGRKLSQVEMAYRFGIDRGHLSEIENGKKNVCLPMLEVLAKGFEISVSELMKGV
jgi:DNA-binding XRE family transcriptional regulator